MASRGGKGGSGRVAAFRLCAGCAFRDTLIGPLFFCSIRAPWGASPHGFTVII
jgi:hypothetical protein